MTDRLPPPAPDATLPRALSGWRDRHRGASVIVAGCGRSAAALADRPACPIIGVNDIGRLIDPDYLVVLNPRDQFRGDRFRHVAATRARAVFTSLDLGISHPRQVRIGLGRRGDPAPDPATPERLPFTRNSPYVALMLARLMGAARIGLIGVDFADDHFFAASGPHPLTRELARIDAEYRAAAEAARKAGVEVVNLSPLSRLRSLPHEPLETFLARAGAPARVPAAPRAAPDPMPTAAPESAPASAPRPRRILHLSLTNCAGALWNLHGLIRDHAADRAESRVATASPITAGRRFPADILIAERARLAEAIDRADLIHFHNTLDRDSPQLAPHRAALARKPAVLQLHSEPAVLRGHFPGRPPERRRDLPVLVVAQKQARFAPNARPVPNALDITLQANRPVPGGADPSAPPGIVFTPTDLRDYPTRPDTCRGKGYRATAALLAELGREGLATPLVATGLDAAALRALRARAAIGIDECVTGGHHLTSLELLARGLVAVAWLDDRSRALIGRVTGADPGALPWLSVPLSGLGPALRDLLGDPARLAAMQAAGRAWMEAHWSPQQVLAPYLDAYAQAEAEFSPARAARAARPPRAAAAAGPRPMRAPRRPAEPAPVAPRPGPDGWIRAELPGRPDPRRSEDFAQSIRLGPALLAARNARPGATAHILGNGPSLATADLAAMAGDLVIGLNASPRIEPRLGRAPDAYCVSDRRFLEAAETRALAAASAASLKVLAGYCAGFLEDPEIHHVRILPGDGISDDLARGAHHCCSAALFAAQVALWMGAVRVVLHGCEFDYGAGRFAEADRARPHDRGTWPRIARNAETLARVLAARGGRLEVAGPSRLTGGFGSDPVPGLRRVSFPRARVAAAEAAAG